MNLFVSLKYLVALDDHRHFGRAALACHVTQPALSNAIRALEESYGCAIVKRGRNFGGFTEKASGCCRARGASCTSRSCWRRTWPAAPIRRAALLIGAVPTAMPIAARFVAQLRERHPGIVPTLRSMSSVELESGLEALALDMGLGYTERVADSRAQLRVLPQYTEHYYLLQRSHATGEAGLRQGTALRWAEAATQPLCLLSPEMHNRRIVDRAFAAAGCQVSAAIESNSTITLVCAVQAGDVAAVLPGALLGTLHADGSLEACPLIEPAIEIPIAFLVHQNSRPSRTLEAALALAASPEWLAHAARHAGAQALPGTP